MSIDKVVTIKNDEYMLPIISEACDFICSYTGLDVKKIAFNALRKGEITGRIHVSANITDHKIIDNEIYYSIMSGMVHEIGEATYALSRINDLPIDKLGKYCGLKRYFGEVVGTYFLELYNRKHKDEIESIYDDFEKVSEKIKYKKLRYRMADSYVKNLMKKPERDQLLEIQKIIFKEQSQTLSFKVWNKFYCILEKIGIF